MSVIGISTDGELVSSTGSSVAKRIEITCEDPRFLERVTRKRPNVFSQFVGGAWSYMRDWGIGVNYCLMLMGVYGDQNKSNAMRWGGMAKDLVAFGFAQPEIAYKVISIKTRLTYSTPAFSGRLVGGGIINTLMLTGGRYGAGLLRSGKSVSLGRSFSRSSALKQSNYSNGAMRRNVPVMGANFILAITGSAILTIKNGNADIASVFSAILTGDYEADPIGSTYRDIFEAAQKLEMEVDPDEIQAMLAILEAIEYCIDHPSSMGAMTEAPNTEARPKVPVGQVSSARPVGVHGLIDQGSETNMLDVIAETSTLYNGK